MCFLYSEASCWTIPSNRPLTIGRGDNNTVVIKNRFVSLIHCKIEVSTDHVLLRDLGSRNGTYVNGKKIEVVALKDNDRIVIGNETFYYSDNQTDLIVTWRDNLQVFLVRKKKWVRVFMASLPMLVILSDTYREQIEQWLSLILELIP